MKRYGSYLKYLIKHKYGVFYAGIKFNLDVSIGRLLIHDMSKFLPGEFISYSKAFYDKNGNFDYKESKSFQENGNSHQKRNKHHGQYWVLILDRGDIITLEIPKNYKHEMIADGLGAGRTINGKGDIIDGYKNNEEKMMIKTTSKGMIESIIENLGIENGK